MSYKLDIDNKFVDSDFVPEVCLFSGKTEGVQPKSMSFTYVPPAAQIGFLIGGALLTMIMSKRFKLDLPTAPKERFRWGFRRNIWALPIFLLPVMFCLVVLPFSNNGEVGLAAGGIGFAIGLLATLIGSIYAWNTNVSFKPIEDGVITIRFPERMKATYEIYREAVANYEKERKARRKNRGSGAEDDGDDIEDGGWGKK